MPRTKLGTLHLPLCRIFFPIVGLKRNLSLLDMFLFFPGGSSNWKGLTHHPNVCQRSWVLYPLARSNGAQLMSFMEASYCGVSFRNWTQNGRFSFWFPFETTNKKGPRGTTWVGSPFETIKKQAKRYPQHKSARSCPARARVPGVRVCCAPNSRHGARQGFDLAV